jgi:putative membrane protein
VRLRPFELDPKELKELPELPAEERLPVGPVREPPPAPPRRGWGWLGGTLVLGTIGLVAFHSIAYVERLIASSPVLGWPLALLTALVGVSAALLVARELRDLRRLQRRSSLRERAERLTGSELHGEAAPLIRAVNAELQAIPGLAQDVVRYEARAGDTLDDGERLRLYERTVLAPVDRRAYRLVLESSRDIGILTALSPLGLLDGFLVLWRTQIMLKSVARLYGMAPGPTASLALLRRSIRNAALAGLADVVAHAATEHIGASLATLLSARAGQGAGNALLHARLGIEAIKASRPLPFIAEEPPKLRHIRKALLERQPSEPLSLD